MLPSGPSRNPLALPSAQETPNGHSRGAARVSSGKPVRPAARQLPTLVRQAAQIAPAMPLQEHPREILKFNSRFQRPQPAQMCPLPCRHKFERLLGNPDDSADGGCAAEFFYPFEPAHSAAGTAQYFCHCPEINTHRADGNCPSYSALLRNPW